MFTQKLKSKIFTQSSLQEEKALVIIGKHEGNTDMNRFGILF